MRRTVAALIVALVGPFAACAPSKEPAEREREVPSNLPTAEASATPAATSVAPAVPSATSIVGSATAPTSASAEPPASASSVTSAPRFLRDNPGCPVPEGYPAWSWKRLHRVEGLADRAVVLTLDVGAKLDNLEKVLEVLRSAGVKTTIFLYTAELARSERGRAIIETMVADGHELANHTVSHKDLTKLEPEAVAEELDGVERFVKSVDDRFTTHPFFREPYLATNDTIDELVRKKCYRPIWFTVDTADWKDDATAAKIESSVFERRGKPRIIEPGSIFIFHGSQKENLVALPRVIDRLKADGFSFLTLGEAIRRAR
ncbi:MAG: polysaccharide deacetylase family protein [Polyangiaceae bacterium]|nr:polysaccharide deacetylase family protein [Polyangiaceae bacterium]